MPPNEDLLASEPQLVSYFRDAAKPPSAWRLGLEQEKIGVRANGDPIPYDGPQGIAELLRRMQSRGFVPEMEGEHVIALGRGNEQITLEPGGQVEFSGPALSTAAECVVSLRQHLSELVECATPLDIHFISGGFRPFCTIDDVPWLPKRRYQVMRAYLPTVGRLSHEMMKRTATVQANLDYRDEADAAERIRTALGITSAVTALFASSPITEGRPNGYKSYRAAVWLEMDEARCGLLPFAFEPGFGFARYAQWALDVPMFFVVRDKEYRHVPGLTFRKFLREGWGTERATMKDWETHLSTLFPEVRLKRYIEVRGADAAPRPLAEGLGALWRGLLDDPEARAAAWALVSDVPMAERERVRRDVPRAGLATRLGRHSLAEIALELCHLSRAGLGRLPGGPADQPLLDPLTDYAARARCPADDMLADLAATNGDPAKLVKRWTIPTT